MIPLNLTRCQAAFMEVMQMNTSMTYSTVAFDPVHTRNRSIHARLRRFFSALMRTNRKTAFDLPADMAARVYL